MKTKQTALKARSEAAYCVQRCSTPSFTPLSVYTSVPGDGRRVQKCPLSFVYARHVRAERLRQRKKHDEIDKNLEHTLACHGEFLQKRSGFRSA